ncbi:MAG: MFS transporter [Bacteroidales bacterium]|nr:MFS transporter [Bacteroidales bacterium]MBN2699034.1 MFS transporter [Bacteroidales bacterium]
MTKEKLNLRIIAPVLLSFFVMSFVDLVGIGVDRAKADFQLSDTMAQLIPSAAFLWFFLLSVPVGIFQDRYGMKRTLNLGMILSALGLVIPFLFYSFPVLLIGFALLGIGNTIIQVSANPLLVNVVPSARASSALSFSQFIKSVGSMLGAPLAGLFAAQFGDWKILLLVFGAVSFLSVLWLGVTKIEEKNVREEPATMGSAFKLLGNGTILSMVLVIFLVVGIDVGVNSTSGQFLMNKLEMEQTIAESGRSFYFFGKMLGTFAGALLLTWLPSRKFLIWSSILTLFSIITLIFNPVSFGALVIIFLIGLFAANIFPLTFSLTISKFPARANEISGLMMMAVSGGAVIPLLIGWLTDRISLTAGMFVLVACALYIVIASLTAGRKTY